MTKLKILHSTLLNTGFKKEAAAILKLSRDTDIYYSVIINKVLDSLRSGNYLPSATKFPGVFLSFSLAIDVPELSYISDYNLNEITIFIDIRDPRISAGLSEREKNKRREMSKGLRKNYVDIPYASQFSFKMDNMKIISSIGIFPNYNLFKKISKMNPQEVITELLNSNQANKEHTLMTVIFHEVTHAIDYIRSNGKYHKPSNLNSLLMDEKSKLLDGDNLSKEEKDILIKNKTNLEKKLEKANDIYKNEYSNDLNEVNARINEVIAAISRGLGINFVTGEGWAEISKKWYDSTNKSNYSNLDLTAERLFEMINNGEERKFIEDIIFRFKKSFILILSLLK